jgi:uncharacterized protein YggE
MSEKLSSFFLAALVAMSGSALASPGTIALTGTGGASSAPDYVSYGVTITSICYNTSAEAAAANAKLASAAIMVLEGFKKDSRDKVIATGGANVLQTEVTQIGIESQVICEMKWHSENRVEIHMTNIPDLPDLQDRLIAAVSGASSVDAETATQTYAEVGRPEFHVFAETARHLRDTAEGLAFDDAKEQLQVFKSRCEFMDLRLVSLTAPEYSYAYKLAGEVVSASASSPTVIPDELRVDASLRMEWSFTPSGACRI